MSVAGDLPPLVSDDYLPLQECSARSGQETRHFSEQLSVAREQVSSRVRVSGAARERAAQHKVGWGAGSSWTVYTRLETTTRLRTRAFQIRVGACGTAWSFHILEQKLLGEVLEL